MFRTVSTYIALLIASIYTVIAYWFGFNGGSTIAIFNRLPVSIAPIKFTYFFWIIVIITTFTYFIKFTSNSRLKIFQIPFQYALFTCNSLVHLIVLFIWHEEQYMSAVILHGALCLLNFSLYITYPLHPKLLNFRVPTAVLFNWQIFLFFFMVHYTLVHYEWNYLNISTSLWAIITMTVMTATSLYLKVQYRDFISPLVFTWCFGGIAIANFPEDLIVTTASLFLIGVLLSSYFFTKNREVFRTDSILGIMFRTLRVLFLIF